MITTIIIYAVFVLPIALSAYAKDKGKFKVIKILNLIVAFYFLSFLSSDFKNNISFLSSNWGNLNDVLFIQVGVIGPVINYSSFFLHTIALFFMLTVVIGLAIRNRKTYYSLKYIIPVFCVLDSVNRHFRLFHDVKQLAQIADWIVFVYSIFITILLWSIFYIIYHLKWFRKFFKESGLNEKINISNHPTAK